MKEKFFTMLSESTIFQGTLMLLVVGAWVYMLVTQTPVPQELSGAALLIIGFFFGGKFTQSVASAVKNGRKE